MKVLLRKSNRFRNKIENHIHLIITNKKKIQICKSNLYNYFINTLCLICKVLVAIKSNANPGTGGLVCSCNFYNI